MRLVTIIMFLSCSLAVVDCSGETQNSGPTPSGSVPAGGESNRWTCTVFVVPKPVPGIVWTSPEKTIARHARQATREEVALVTRADGRVLKEEFYHIFKLPNEGPVRLEWTGYANANGQLYIKYWDGERFVGRDIRKAWELDVHSLEISRPAKEEFFYILVNCSSTKGRVFTDHIRVYPIDTSKDGEQAPERDK